MLTKILVTIGMVVTVVLYMAIAVSDFFEVVATWSGRTTENYVKFAVIMVCAILAACSLFFVWR